MRRRYSCTAKLGALKAAALTRSQLGRVNLITIGLIGKQVRRVHDAGIDVAARRLGGKTLGNRIERRQALEYATVTMRGQQLVLACEQARQIVMGTQDVERIGWMRRQPLPRQRPVRRRPRGRRVVRAAASRTP